MVGPCGGPGGQLPMMYRLGAAEEEANIRDPPSLFEVTSNFSGAHPYGRPNPRSCRYHSLTADIFLLRQPSGAPK